MLLIHPAYNDMTKTFCDAHQIFPWFSLHTSPQPAVVEGNDTVTLYVGTGQ